MYSIGNGQQPLPFIGLVLGYVEAPSQHFLSPLIKTNSNERASERAFTVAC